MVRVREEDVRLKARLCVRERERSDDATRLAFNVKEGDTSPGMQGPPAARKGKEQTVPRASRRSAALPTP